MTHTKDKRSRRVVITFAIVGIAVVAFLLCMMDKKSSTMNGSGESRVSPTVIDEVEAPLPLQIDTNAPAKVTVRTNISL